MEPRCPFEHWHRLLLMLTCVNLFQNAKNNGETFALKCLKKRKVADIQKQEHVLREKRIMMSCNHHLIAR